MTSSTKYLTIPAVVASALGLGAGAAVAAEPTTEQLMEQIQQLQAKVQQLETKQQTLASKDVDATVESVLRDADKRSQLLQMEGFTAGWQKGKGFILQSADGNFVMHPNLQFQFRSVTNYRDEGKHLTATGGDTDWENGFEIRRFKFGVDGNAFTPDFQYFFLWQADRDGGGLSLDQAWIKYFFADAWATRVGQIVNPTFHETNTSSRRQLLVERSLAHEIITGSNEAQTQAVTLMYDSANSPITAEVGVEDGYVSNNTNFVDTNEGGSNDWGVFGRVNWFVMGDHKSYDDFTAMGNKNDLLVIGAGGDVTQAGDVTSYRHTVDVQWENTSGLGIYAAYLGNFIDNSASGADDDYNWAALVQAGYMVNEKLEIFGRYDYTKIDSNLAVGGEDSWNEITGGINYYLNGGHSCKITVDLTYLPDGAPSDFTDLGILASGNDEWMLRGQFQLLL
jgi:outer membrane murein-binding lipoprotein Lpp